jgi:hypothetical protein
MASGHVNRTNRPNTWLHRPAMRREDFPCQPGAVHTLHIAGQSICDGLSAAGTWQNRAHGAVCPELAKADGTSLGSLARGNCNLKRRHFAPSNPPHLFA